MPADISQLTSDANSGDLEAQIQLADLYESGFGVSVDLDQATYWYRRSAEAGSAITQNKLAQLFINGKGVMQDNTQAFHWFSLVANQNDDAAQASLA